MFFKIIGSILIFVSSCRIGFKLAENLTLRTSELRDIKQGLCSLKNEIAFNGVPLGRGMKNSSCFMCSAAAQFFDVGEETPKEDFLKKLDTAETHLNKDDIKILKDFSALLGSSDYEGQANNFDLCISRLDGQIEISEGNCLRYTKLYRQCGVLGGLFLVVLLI